MYLRRQTGESAHFQVLNQVTRGVDVTMAKQQDDRTTLDLFSEEKRPGRPKTNPLPRSAQLKVNKRNQLRRDKANGLRRVELKMEAEMLEQLNALAKAQNLSRADLIQVLIKQHIETNPVPDGRD